MQVTNGIGKTHPIPISGYKCLALSAIALAPSKLVIKADMGSLPGQVCMDMSPATGIGAPFPMIHNPLGSVGIFPLASMGFANPRVSAYINLAAGCHNLR